MLPHARLARSLPEIAARSGEFRHVRDQPHAMPTRSVSAEKLCAMIRRLTISALSETPARNHSGARQQRLFAGFLEGMVGVEYGVASAGRAPVARFDGFYVPGRQLLPGSAQLTHRFLDGDSCSSLARCDARVRPGSGARAVPDARFVVVARSVRHGADDCAGPGAGAGNRASPCLPCRSRASPSCRAGAAPLTLPELTEFALRNNPRARQAWFAARAAAAGVGIEQGDDLPQITASVGFNRAQPVSGTTGAHVALDQPLRPGDQLELRPLRFRRGRRPDRSGRVPAARGESRAEPRAAGHHIPGRAGVLPVCSASMCWCGSTSCR